MGQSTTVIPTGSGGAKVQDSIPTNPQKGDLWVDTSLSTPATKWYDGTEFIRISPTESQTESVETTETVATETLVIDPNSSTTFTISGVSDPPVSYSVENPDIYISNVEKTGIDSFTITAKNTDDFQSIGVATIKGLKKSLSHTHAI